jgi:hypothetical protein
MERAIGEAGMAARSGVIGLVLLLAGTGAASADSTDPTVNAAVKLMASAIYVQNVTGYCTSAVGLDPRLLDAAARWTDRNARINQKAVAVAETLGGLTQHDERMLARNADETIKADLARRASIREFCARLPERINSGDIDLDKRPELADAVRRVMAAPGPSS